MTIPSYICAICGEQDADAEMYLPCDCYGLCDGGGDKGCEESSLVHAECGLLFGWSVS